METMADQEGNGGENERQVGRPSPTSKAELLETVDKVMADTDSPFATTGEVTERVEIKERTVRKKLHELVDEGVLASRKVGSGRVWWIANANSEDENR